MIDSSFITFKQPTANINCGHDWMPHLLYRVAEYMARLVNDTITLAMGGPAGVIISLRQTEQTNKRYPPSSLSTFDLVNKFEKSGRIRGKTEVQKEEVPGKRALSELLWYTKHDPMQKEIFDSRKNPLLLHLSKANCKRGLPVKGKSRGHSSSSWRLLLVAHNMQNCPKAFLIHCA